MKPEEKEAKRKYKIVAEHYHNFRTKMYPGGWMYNEMLEMPGTFELLGNVKGKKVLDFGCGAGIYARILTEKGAKVKGFDLSEEMLKIAKRENPKLDLRLGSGYNIPFKEKFDVVIAPLVLDYFNDWDKTFREVNRVLKKKGIFVFTIGNPVSEITVKADKNKLWVREFQDYFKERKVYGTWYDIVYKGQVRDVKMPSYHKTYETVIKTIIRNGFEIIDYKDCFPLKKAKKIFPKHYQFLSKVPYFCVWKVKKK